MSENERADCYGCRDTRTHTSWIYCDKDGRGYGRECLGLSQKKFDLIAKEPTWICPTCTEKEHKSKTKSPTQREPEARTTNEDEDANDSQNTEVANEAVVLQERSSQENHQENPATSEGRQPGHADEIEQQGTDDAPARADSARPIEPIASTSRGHTTTNEQILEEDEISSSGSSTDDSPNEPHPRPVYARMSTARKTSAGRDPLVPAGHHEVKKVVGHRQVGARREFKLRFVDSSEFWVRESDCDNCVKRIMNYCNRKGIRQTGLPQPRAGASGKTEPEMENWVTASEVIRKASIYGKIEGLQPYVFEKKKMWDSLYLDQVGEHFFVVLYLHKRNLALVADGLNSLPEDKEAMEMLQEDFAPAEIRVVKFTGQNRDDRCGSAAVAIILEFQKSYDRDEIPTELIPERVTYSRVDRALHKVRTPKITPWTPIQEPKIGVECPRCKKSFRNAKSRAVLNFHKCEL